MSCFSFIESLIKGRDGTVPGSMLYEVDNNFAVEDVEKWMWHRSSTRAGFWQIQIPLKTEAWEAGITIRRIKTFFGLKTGRSAIADGVVYKHVNLSQKEFALLDKVVTNQIYSESKTKIYRGIVFQRSLQLWESGSEDDVAMRTIAPWAMAHYKCQSNKFTTEQPCCLNLFKLHDKKYRTRLNMIKGATESKQGGVEDDVPTADEVGLVYQGTGYAPSPEPAARNELGYQAPGAEFVNKHEGGGQDDEDSEVRAQVQGRIIKKDCGVGVVGQSLDDSSKRRVVGVLSQPISKEPNVYAQELLNAITAIEERINKKQRPYSGTEEDKKKIGRFVVQSIHGKKNAPFSTKKVLDCIHELVYEEMKSKKWTEERLTQAIEKLCREIDPTFKLKAAIKMEPMPEGKAPRLLIADEDVGQVMALMTIYCIETLIKKHFPEKGIKGMCKKDAIKRVMKACKVPRKAAKKLVTVFEGDGSAWDTTCSATIREYVENPVINHVANLVNGFLYASPDSWAKAHATICSEEKLDMTYSKNKEYQKLTINAIRRSGHRGTSCLNWWINFVCWHCAIFEDPENFLDASHRYGKDVTGTTRWFNSAFEGDDSFLVTSPKIEAGHELHTAILQFWERIGFNMKIEIRSSRALFVGYYIGLGKLGPEFDEEKDEWMMVPEIDRCFARSGTSCSPAMIDAFNADQTDKCMSLAGSAAMSRAYEFAGLCPLISEKFLQYAIDCNFAITHDLKMRTNEEFDDKNELVDHIRALNATCAIEDNILTSTLFWASEEERARFQDHTWDYTQLAEWEDFYNSLPRTWRQ
jgi:hypothetical protein